MVPPKGTDNSNVTESDVAIRRDWSTIRTPEDVQKVLLEQFGNIIEGKQLLGNEFDSTEKEKLIGVPFVILEYGFGQSEQITRDGAPTEYAWVRGINMNTMEKVAFADGSTGICRQLVDIYTRTKQDGGIVCKNGLRVSEYDYTDKDGNTAPARTYYLDS